MHFCLNKNEGGDEVQLQGVELEKITEFKHLGSSMQKGGEHGREIESG